MTQPFADFAPRAASATPLRAAITAACRIPEPQALAPLLEQARLPQDKDEAVQALALRIAGTLRQRKASAGRAGIVQGLLQEFALSSQEGVALMCLAEALLRIPDAATRDALIRDKISNGQWENHLGKSPSLFVNAATWGLLLTGKLTATHSEGSLSASLGRLIGRGGEPLIRKGVDMAMRMMGEQFVTGETIAEALANARKMEAEGFRYSYDMLGEAALTSEDAARYYQSYEQAIHAIGQASNGRGIYEGPGISIKLSALHPRYSRAQWERVMDELYPRVLRLTELARQYDIGLNIDAEETERLEISLDLLERLCHAPSLQGWNGIGFVIQAYQKRCPCVIDFCVDLARRTQRRLMVRLVKGAYWDSEIKRAQVDGLADYPVYTRKVHTDVSYLACARKLLAAPEAIYPQFATHNAHTLAAIYHLAGHNYYAGQYEFQCLHGMGEPLYEQVVGAVAAGKLGRPCRIYAPVGTHETLLAYLVRRLLENGANTSFVNRIADPSIALEDLVQNPVAAVLQAAQAEGSAGLPHPRIPLPLQLYGSERANARGLDLASEQVLDELAAQLAQSAAHPWHAGPLLAQDTPPAATVPVRNPADQRDLVGQVQEATPAEVDQALAWAAQAAPHWAATAPAERAAALLRAADLLEAQMPQLLGLLMREAGKTAANAVAEVREAVDFLRYYAAQARSDFDNSTHLPLGPVVCISPWNFPLAIFMGQVAAALAAGNVVLAKPAEQTPLVAAQAVRTLWQAGVPRAAVQLLPGQGESVGARLVADARTMGVVFTGSTEVAHILQRTLAGRLDAAGQPITLIAETGGQNAMIVDSSALAEQVVGDAVASAFDSAGQRCSALRVLCVQEEAAERIVAMLQGAMGELRVGRPDALRTDVGPVIDAEAQKSILGHIERLRAQGRRVYQAPAQAGTEHGTFVPPTLIEIEHLGELQREVFGPVLHVVRYARKDLPRLMQQISATGYGLTLGLHTRIDETIAQVLEQAHAGNIYVNRNMVGAVVGVQPFGGEGLSGTGPKAGGPMYLLRLLARYPAGALVQRLQAGGQAAQEQPPALQALHTWALQRQDGALASACERLGRETPSGTTLALPGPTGESNTYRVLARARVLCLADQDADLLVQLAAVLAAGGQAVWSAAHAGLRDALPAALQEHVSLAADWQQDSVWFDAVLHHGSADALRAVCQSVAQRPGPIVGVTGLRPGDSTVPLERLVHERSVSVNTAAAGGNASLMTIG
ncbi:trifunctional transcriptional regulator/proline dehydrogenase/L-glutamate gamma-semialdehyde dehydrogenase [Comamonas granuli]|uniref:trifunctional transcriptional regulator/proline dehydrogenase/L-glutamate gamma-semialdehyde dehydrogenase n=1 Tax=Comamonas granuli TaxID=290309 RepID=UPI0005A706B9|nr:trifunctional transcriptional regulator/proline dehydrogenase/L-glutamate gamma-semialdehyde dehydrogenase [Comamonas granuli]